VTLASALVLGVRSVRGWRRLALPALALVVVYVAGFAITISVYATNVGRPHLGRETPADIGLRYVDASFTTADGVTLSGWYLPSANHAAVVLLHGASSTRSAVLDQAAVVARHGYGVLLFDARGMGRSGGRAMDLGWYGDLDVRAAVDYLVARPEIDPARIAALGESMGGEEAIGALADDPRLRSVVAEGATNRVVADWKWLPDRYGARGLGQLGVQWLTSSLTDLLTDASPPVSLRSAVARAAPRRILLIAAGKVSDEVSADRYIEAGSPGTVEVWVVAGAGHTGGLRAQPDAWERTVVGFLDRSLGVGTNASTP
jgi:pimeloyl-ACP methyl ester carboxylesterase